MTHSFNVHWQRKQQQNNRKPKRQQWTGPLAMQHMIFRCEFRISSLKWLFTLFLWPVRWQLQNTKLERNDNGMKSIIITIPAVAMSLAFLVRFSRDGNSQTFFGIVKIGGLAPLWWPNVFFRPATTANN